MAEAHPGHGRVGLPVVDVPDPDPQPVGGNLAIGGRVSLAVGLGSDPEFDPAGGGEPHLRPLGQVSARRLEETRNPEAA